MLEIYMLLDQTSKEINFKKNTYVFQVRSIGNRRKSPSVWLQKDNFKRFKCHNRMESYSYCQQYPTQKFQIKTNLK